MPIRSTTARVSACIGSTCSTSSPGTIVKGWPARPALALAAVPAGVRPGTYFPSLLRDHLVRWP